METEKIIMLIIFAIPMLAMAVMLFSFAYDMAKEAVWYEKAIKALQAAIDYYEKAQTELPKQEKQKPQNKIEFVVPDGYEQIKKDISLVLMLRDKGLPIRKICKVAKLSYNRVYQIIQDHKKYD